MFSWINWYISNFKRGVLSCSAWSLESQKCFAATRITRDIPRLLPFRHGWTCSQMMSLTLRIWNQMWLNQNRRNKIDDLVEAQSTEHQSPQLPRQFVEIAKSTYIWVNRRRLMFKFVVKWSLSHHFTVKEETVEGKKGRKAMGKRK